MSTNRISAEHTAKALLINLALYKEGKGKDLSRFRISKKSLKLAANRLALREAFVAEVIDEMAQLGWSCIDEGTMTTEGELAFIQSDKIDVWPRLGVLRIRSLVRMKGSLEDVHEVIDDDYYQYYPEQDDDVLALDE
ncbi:hypothetical protein KW834_03315 [Pseudomonas sp. PDM29]|uniref:hypothetical protein n=1 Tax=Pseudomonas sp. PDM29 TaxID=2854771 RepID=UPI001C47E476|nr:hypothetical protein [Pseudomonas sp. PDM29]MBV7523435.1 hypothetical protein [Pseudomonas sp. PDM29]